MPKTCIIIAGPTAVGKTATAIQVAKHFNTEIISADSRQCFQELNIGVAKPSTDELAAIRHHFINAHSVHETVTAATFEQYALEKISEIFADKDYAVVCGGTGLYINAFCHGLDSIPEIGMGIRQQILTDYKEKGIEFLQAALENEDADFAHRGEMQNPQRMMRALEVVRATGKSIFSFRNGEKKERPFSIVKFCLQMPREQLYCRINSRVEAMMEAGLLKEAELLLPYRSLNALQTVGYKELFEYFDGVVSLEDAIENIKKNTRNYAKRQETWFKKDAAMHYCGPSEVEAIIRISTQA